MPDTNITEAHIASFETVCDPNNDNLALASCFVNGKPAAAIVAVLPDPSRKGGTRIYPLWVSITDDMLVTDHDGVRPHVDPSLLN